MSPGALRRRSRCSTRRSGPRAASFAGSCGLVGDRDRRQPGADASPCSGSRDLLVGDPRAELRSAPAGAGCSRSRPRRRRRAPSAATARRERRDHPPPCAHRARNPSSTCGRPVPLRAPQNGSSTTSAATPVADLDRGARARPRGAGSRARSGRGRGRGRRCRSSRARARRARPGRRPRPGAREPQAAQVAVRLALVVQAGDRLLADVAALGEAHGALVDPRLLGDRRGRHLAPEARPAGLDAHDLGGRLARPARRRRRPARASTLGALGARRRCRSTPRSVATATHVDAADASRRGGRARAPSGPAERDLGRGRADHRDDRRVAR